MMTTGGVATYAVTVQGRLDEAWFDWPVGMTCAFEAEPDGPGITLLTGSFDQAALRGLLATLWDLNLTVLGVTRCLDRSVTTEQVRSGEGALP